ncbi:magnesium transporter MRS2-F-like isoform X2 [Magnolia sinica]|uniref:magnesium transporter MRS2-F-like isoform X2 n=1 Tax=Magnolia sinica TaxID=86752 RepID=UPI002658957F|nr:magnesium transporter MRS2-F-like isoform X2 [Magnolia sinica]
MRPSSRISSEEDLSRIPFIPPHQARRKGAGTRTWLVVTDSGQSYLENVGKHSIMRRTGLPARDLRVLDPMLSYPSTILGRERAIVISLEHIKAIITAKEVLVLNSKDPMVAPFIQDLQHRILNSHGVGQSGIENDDTEMEDRIKAAWGSPSFHARHESVRSSSTGVSQQFNASPKTSRMMPEAKESSPWSTLDMHIVGGPKVLPFEFRVLEVCLESTCRSLEIEVRDEIEHLLDDDMDMAEMYLTDKLAQQSLSDASSRDELDIGAFELGNERDEDTKSKSRSFNESSRGFKPDIEELEMLLEAYFVQIDGTLQKLSTMREYVDDTEDYINIMLDDKQNQLLQMGVKLSTGNLVFNAGIVVVGIFGMNIHISLFDTGPRQFWEATLGTTLGCVVLYVMALGWGKTKGLFA